jgi:hypothetical protein
LVGRVASLAVDADLRVDRAVPEVLAAHLQPAREDLLPGEADLVEPAALAAKVVPAAAADSDLLRSP